MEGGDLLAALKPVPQRRNGERSRSHRGGSDRAQFRLQALCQIATRHRLLVLADEAYASIVFDGRPGLQQLLAALTATAAKVG